MDERDRKPVDTAVAISKILVIEDNRDSRDILSKLLRMSGYDVISASDGAAGFDAALEQLPDLIITDINMPRMDGLEFVKRIRTREAIGRTPILVVTAFGSNIARDAVNAGADASVEKPFDFDKFLVLVKDLIAQNHKPARS
jgi:CheY-like chemotaxis protein